MLNRLHWPIMGLLLSLVITFSIGLGVLSVILYQVFWGEDNNLKKSVIMAKINEESVIYFQDEITPIGSFFENAHRRYVPIDEIPEVMLQALVAGEDKNFYDHKGIDPMAIFRAFVEGVKLGRFRQGGSTLTQQTVKNIINRWDPTFQRKFKEWIAAIQLERMYSKREILEFYLNQFHVAQNGNGIGIAMEYYFDKSVAEINLIEAAFIAGSVKAPSKYNPFIKFTKEAREQAIAHANERKNYVLRRMYEQQFLSKEEFETALSTPVPFKKGKFGSNEVSLLDLIKRQLNRQEIFEDIGVESLDDLSRAGLKIITTIDHDLQDQGQLVMRRRLSNLQTTLKGFKAEPAEQFKHTRRLETNQFYYGKISEIKGSEKDAELTLDFGLPKGTVPLESLIRHAKLIDLATDRGFETELKTLLKTMKVGDVVYVEALEVNENGDHGVMELHHKPEVNGGLIAIDHGEVRAAIPGFDSLGFNRSWDARRQPGSVFKTVVYYGACQLGWSILDNIDNQRQVFPYQRQLYFPKPDHPSPYRKTSILWAGIMSENLASVHLTYRLVEKLNFEQFKQLMGFMDLLPTGGEAPADFHYRVAKKIGVELSADGISEQQLQNAIKIDVIPDLTFSRSADLIDSVNKMWYGRGFEQELQQFSQPGFQRVHSEKERAIRLKLVKNNFLRHNRLAAELERDWQEIQKFVDVNGANAAAQHANVGGLIKRFRKLGSLGRRPELAYYRVFDQEPLNVSSAETESNMFNPFAGTALNEYDVQAVWGSSSYSSGFESVKMTLDEVLLEGFLPYQIHGAIARALNSRFEDVRRQSDPYDLNGYYQHHDFRVALGLNYLVALAKAMGVRSELEPVLSFPLGSNVVSIAEVAKIYQTFISGRSYRFFNDGAQNQLNLIKRIVDRDGKELYAPRAQEFQLASHECSLQMREILEKIVTNGTGRRARGELHVDPKEGELGGQAIRVPAFGKTGTTNDYNTSSFAGFMPYPTVKGDPLNPENSYVIAAYVGYDIPATMRKGRFKVSGSMGALPVWTDFAKVAIDKKKYADYLDNLDLSLISRKEWPLRRPSSLTPLSIDLPRGLVLKVAGSEDYEQFNATNLNQTGEEYQSEFAHGVGRSVSAVVRIPSDTSRGTWQPLKVFSPFRTQSEEQDDIAPSKVDEQSQNLGDGALKTPPVAAASPDMNAPDQTPPDEPSEQTESKTSAPASGTPPAADDLLESTEQPSPPEFPEETGSTAEQKEEGSEPKQEDATDYIEEDLW